MDVVSYKECFEDVCRMKLMWKVEVICIVLDYNTKTRLPEPSSNQAQPTTRNPPVRFSKAGEYGETGFNAES